MSWFKRRYVTLLPVAICGEWLVETTNREMLAFWVERMRAEKTP